MPICVAADNKGASHNTTARQMLLCDRCKQRIVVCSMAVNIKYRNLAAINVSGMYDSVVVELTFARKVYIVVQLTPQIYLHTMKKTVFSVSKVLCFFEV